MLMPITSLKKGWEYKGVSYTETKSLQWSTKMKPKLLPIPPLVPLRPPSGVGKTMTRINVIPPALKHPHGRGEDAHSDLCEHRFWSI